MTTEQAPRVGALLIHGLGGTQYDLGPMHKVLRRGGVDTHAVTLPGHGGTHHAGRPCAQHRHIEPVFPALCHVALSRSRDCSE